MEWTYLFYFPLFCKISILQPDEARMYQIEWYTMDILYNNFSHGH